MLPRASWPLALLVGCGGSAPVPAAAITLAPAEYDAATSTLTELASGGTLGLVFPPQGGYVSFVGARVHNLADGIVELHGRLLDPVTGATRFEDSRIVQMQRDPQDPTLWLPDLRSYINVSNITICPWSGPTNLYDVPFTLELEVRETSTPRTGSQRVPITTSCRQPNATDRARCQCVCGARFMPGRCP